MYEANWNPSANGLKTTSEADNENRAPRQWQGALLIWIHFFYAPCVCNCFFRLRLRTTFTVTRAITATRIKITASTI